VAEAGSLVGRTLAETYQVVRLIGKGGMGAIYEAHHVRLHGKRYAIKILAPQFAENPELLARFRREAEIASQLGHENIVEVHDFNVADGQAYMVMELLDGQDLAGRLQTRGPMAIEQTKRILDQVASALEAAHRAHIVHRDLKPQNIYLCRRGGRDDYVKVLDFGVSKVLDSSSVVTRDHALVGTPFYMSPEQAEGKIKEIDPRTDVFALGAIVWEMLTGRMAFGAPTFSVALYKVCFVDPPDVHLVRPDVPPAVSMVLRRALAKERSLRTGTVAEMAAELAAALHGVMPANVPPPALEGTGSVAGVVASPMHRTTGSIAVAGTSPASAPPMPSSGPTPGPAPSYSPTPASFQPQASQYAQPSHPPAPQGYAAPPGSAYAPEPAAVGTPAYAGTSPWAPAPASMQPAPPWQSPSVAAGSVVAPPPPVQGRGKLIALFAILIVGGGVTGAGLYLTLGRGNQPDPAVTPANPNLPPTPNPNPSPPPTPTPAAAPERLPDVSINFTVEPSDVAVEIRLDGEMVADRHVRVARSDKPRAITAEAKGYSAWKSQVVPDQDRTVAITLKKKAAPAPKAPPPQPPSTPEPSPYPPVNPAPPQPQPSTQPPPQPQPQPPPAQPPPQPEKPKKRTGTIFDQ